MKKIMQIMKEIYFKPEQLDEKHFRDNYPEDTYKQFSQFALGGNEPYAKTHPPKNVLKLTTAGVREYHRLVSEKNTRDLTRTMVAATFFVGVATVALVFVELFSVLKSPDWIVIVGTLAIAGMVLLALHAVKKYGEGFDYEL